LSQSRSSPGVDRWCDDKASREDHDHGESRFAIAVSDRQIELLRRLRGSYPRTSAERHQIDRFLDWLGWRELAIVWAHSSASGAGGELERDLLRRYVEAWERPDMDVLVDLLREDAALTMPPQPSIHGARAIADFFGGVLGRVAQCPTPTWANGRPAVLLRERGDRAQLRAHRLLVLDVDAASGRIGALHAHREPAVLTAFGG